MFGIAAILVVILFLVILFKYQNFQGNVANFIVAGVLIALVGSISYFYFMIGADISTFDGLVSFLRIYFSWMGNVLGNTGDIAGYVIHQNWTAIENITAAQ